MRKEPSPLGQDMHNQENILGRRKPEHVAGYVLAGAIAGNVVLSVVESFLPKTINNPHMFDNGLVYWASVVGASVLGAAGGFSLARFRPRRN